MLFSQINLFNIINVLFVAVYFPIKQKFLNGKKLEKIVEFNLTTEMITILMCSTVLIVKLKNIISQEHFLSLFFFYSKITICVLIYKGGSVKILLYYLLCWFVQWLLIKQPKYQGKTNLTQIDTEQFNHLQKFMKEEKKPIYWFLVCYADFSEHCFYTERIWAYFSNQYHQEKFLFCKIDLEKNQKIADHLNINISGYSRQLPTVILYKNGEEIKRFPAIDNEGRVGKVLKYQRIDLERYF